MILALTRTLNNYATKNNLLKGGGRDKITTISGDDIREGLSAVISVSMLRFTWFM